MSYSDFSWSDYCFRVKDSSVCAEYIIRVTISDMDAYITLYQNLKLEIPRLILIALVE